METFTLEAKTRTETGKGPSRRLRREGLIPSVTYRKGTETLALAVSRSALRTILKSDRGKNSLIDLTVDGGAAMPVMVKEYTIHPVTRQLVHADFVQVARDQPIELDIPFRRVGRCKGEQAGGTLLQTVRTLRVRCLPENIPSHIEPDVTELDIDQVLRVSDLTLPEGIEVLHPIDQKLMVVKPPRVEEVPAEAEAAEGEEGVEKPAEGEEGAAEGAKPAEGAEQKADDKATGKD